MRNAVFVVAVFGAMCLLAGCAAGRAAGKSASSEIEIQSWQEYVPSQQYEPLDKRMERLAVEAETAYTRRIRNRSTVMDSDYLTDCVKRVYILSDWPLTIEPGVPELIVANDLDELERIARETKKNVVYLELKTLGQTTVKGKRGVVIQCDASVVEWDRAAWKALPNAEKVRRPTPEFGVSDYRWTTIGFVTRSGKKLLILDRPKIAV